MVEDRDRKRRRVADGATLFSGKTGEPREKRRIPKIDISKTSAMVRHIPDTQNLDKLVHQLDLLGVDVKSYKDQYLLRRIRARLGKLRLNRYEDYMKYIKSSPQEITELKESLSINVTRFFRNRDTYLYIKEHVMPEIFRKAQSKASADVKFLSVGCAVGPEPYSLAMIASDIKPKTVNIKIHASDINQDLLDTARFATYSKQYVAEMDKIEVSRYFDVNKFGEYVVKSDIRRSVNFFKKDLMSDAFPGGTDLILCRNVLIYIDREAQNQVISKFINSLKPGGFLVLGRTETLFLDWRKYVDIISAKHRIYQKKSGVEVSPTKEYQVTDRKHVFKTKVKPKVDLTSRLEDLRNFRAVFEERKKKWEARIEDSKLLNEKNRQRVMREKITASKKPFSPLTSPTRIGQTRRLSSSSGSLTNYRSMLKKVGDKSKISSVRRDTQIHRIKDEENVSPEEYYRRLKERRRKRKR